MLRPAPNGGMSTPSHSSGIAGFPKALILGSLGAAVVGAVYQVVTDINPFVYVNILLTLAFAAITGAIVGGILNAAGNHSRLQAVVGAAFAVSVGIAAGFVTNFYVTAGDLIAEVGDPVRAFQMFLEFRIEAGWEFSRRASTITVDGNMVRAVWGAEYGLALVAASLRGATMLG